MVFLFKFPTDTPYRAEKPQDGNFDEFADQSLFFAHQSIQNACGTQAILSILLNKNDASASESGGVDLGSALGEFKDFTMAFDPSLRGDALSNSEDIRAAHNQFARSSPFVDETQKPDDAEQEDVFHFIAYTPINGVLYELDGLQPHPIAHGACSGDSSEFAEKVIPVLQRRIDRYPMGEIRFNLLAVCRDLRVRMREIGDSEGLAREEEKRRAWEWENALRRHNFLGFVGEVTKITAQHKQKEGTFDSWVEEARGKTRKRLEERRAGKQGMDLD